MQWENGWVRDTALVLYTPAQRFSDWCVILGLQQDCKGIVDCESRCTALEWSETYMCCDPVTVGVPPLSGAVRMWCCSEMASRCSSGSIFPSRSVEELLPDCARIVLGRLCFGLLLGFVVPVSWIGVRSGMELSGAPPLSGRRRWLCCDPVIVWCTTLEW